MEDKRLSKTLPEDLVEKIVSMMPFPAIFKARGLSKSWLAKFSPVSSQDEEEKKRAAITFQKLVREQSTKWSIFFPVCRDKDFFSTYDWQQQHWIRFPIPSFLLKKYPTSKSRPGILGIVGTLLYCAKRKNQIFYVANIITREWKKLPARPILSTDSSEDSLGCARLSPILVRDTSLETYKVIVLHGYQGGNLFSRWYIQIYDSTLDSWSTKKLIEGAARLHRVREPYGSPVYLNGVLYVNLELPNEDFNNVICLVMFNIEKGTFEELEVPWNSIIGERCEWEVDLVVCCAKLMMIVTGPEPEDLYSITSDAPCVLLHVLTVDVGSRQLLEVTRGPPDTLEIQSGVDYTACTDGKCIFFKSKSRQYPTVTPVVAYNVQEDEWTYFDSPLPADTRWSQSTVFHPGLNPFAEV